MSYTLGAKSKSRLVGVHPQLVAVVERAILLTNMQRISGPVMSEHVLAMMLALGRGLPVFPQRREQVVGGYARHIGGNSGS